MARDREPVPSLDPASPDPTTEVRLDVTIGGRVQGVGFRYYVLRRAVDLGLVGWVMNTDRGVRCVVEGPRARVEQLLEIVGIGPAGALVEEIRPNWSGPTGGFSTFEIRSGAHPGD